MKKKPNTVDLPDFDEHAFQLAMKQPWLGYGMARSAMVKSLIGVGIAKFLIKQYLSYSSRSWPVTCRDGDGI